MPRRPSSTAPGRGLFIYGWNQYLWPLLITDSPTMTTIIIGIRQMIGNGDAQTEWHLVMATALLAILPSVAIVLAMQRWFLAGLIEPEKRRSVSESVQRRVERLSKRSNTATPYFGTANRGSCIRTTHWQLAPSAHPAAPRCTSTPPRT